jgi:peptide/nickel transport system substrate-binding protein
MASDFAFIYSPSAFIRDGNSSTVFGRNPVGTGPYTFKEWVDNDHLTMVANPNYWGNKPYIQTIVIHIIPDATARLLALQSGEIQLADVPPQYAQQLNTSSTVVSIGPFNRVIDMDINVNNKSNPAFQDVRVRQALNYAVNRTALAAAVYYGYAQPATGGPLVPGPLYAPFASNYSMYPAGGNITKAKQLLAAAGYSNGINVTIDFNGAFVNSLTIATILQQQWAQAGITVNLLNKDFGLFVSDLDPCRCYQLDIHDSAGYTPFEEWQVDYVPNGGFQDLGNNDNATLISLVNQLGQTNIGNVTAYRALSDQINMYGLQQAYLIYLFYAPLIQGWSSSLHGYSIPNPLYTGYIISSTPLGVNCYLS